MGIKPVYHFFVICIMVCVGVKTYAQNLALHKPYTMSEKPNYPTTAPLNDKISLTDGIYATPYSKGHKRYWTQKAFLGWNYKKQVKITIDLKQESPIKS